MIFVEDQHIKINGAVLPGVVKSIEVKGSARIDEQEVEGSSAKPKQAVGYEDAKISIELILDDTETETKYQRLEILQNLFRKPGQGVPQPIPIVCEDTAARGISSVLFKDFSHKGESKKEQLSATLEFWEYVPQTVKASKGTGKSAAQSAAPGDGLSTDYQNYLSKNRGMAPKSKKSPATDDADVSKHKERLHRLPK